MSNGSMIQDLRTMQVHSPCFYSAIARHETQQTKYKFWCKSMKDIIKNSKFSIKALLHNYISKVI